jgi:hypothetical protein
VQVPAIRLDDLEVPEGAVLKIDVEGHEVEVLESGPELLTARVPSAILIEAEERHRSGSTREVIQLLSLTGYRGWAIQGWKLIPADRFVPEEHQAAADAAQVAAGGPRPSSYANNFCFVRNDLADGVVESLEPTPFSVVD